MGELVGGDDQHRPDDALDQAGRGRYAPLSADDALEIDVRIEHLTGCWADRVALEQNLLEADCESQAQAQDEQQDHHAEYPRQGDVPQPLPASGAVHHRGLIQGGFDVQQRGQEDDRGIARLLPDQL